MARVANLTDETAEQILAVTRDHFARLGGRGGID